MMYDLRLVHYLEEFQFSVYMHIYLLCCSLNQEIKYMPCYCFLTRNQEFYSHHMWKLTATTFILTNFILYIYIVFNYYSLILTVIIFSWFLFWFPGERQWNNDRWSLVTNKIGKSHGSGSVTPKLMLSSVRVRFDLLPYHCRSWENHLLMLLYVFSVISVFCCVCIVTFCQLRVCKFVVRY